MNKTNKKQKKQKRAKKAKINVRALSLIRAPFSPIQMLTIRQQTPTSEIYHHKGKGGGEVDYVRGSYIKDQLNKIFGFMWDFEVVEHGHEKDLVWVLGKLTVKDTKGHSITKMQFGRSEVKYYRDRTKGTVDFGNDLKSATTDALKKCASEFGLASDVFWKQETKEVQQVDKTYIPEVVKENKVAELLATEEEKKKIVDLTKDLGAKTPQATAKMVENIVKGNVDWNKMPKVLAGKVYAELLRKQINKK